MATKQLECRIVITHLPNKCIMLGMWDPLNMRYEPLGTHGPSQREINKAIYGLKDSIERAGHKLTFCVRSK